MNTIALDKTLFDLINQGLSHPLLDMFLVWIRHPMFWVPLYVFTIGFMMMNYGRKGYLYIVFLLLVFGSTDIVSSRVIKPAVQRLRPCNQDEMQVIERVRCGNGYSFTSSHAANHFGISTFVVLTFGQYFSKLRPWMWTWAALISFAQVYVGVHFPLDILGGAIIGILVGGFWSFLYHHRRNFKYKIMPEQIL
jgi:membrane-associated phospholipid phosphatase